MQFTGKTNKFPQKIDLVAANEPISKYNFPNTLNSILHTKSYMLLKFADILDLSVRTFLQLPPKKI